MKLRLFKILWTLALFSSAIAPAQAQQLLDSYTAIIRQEDRVNSKGTALSSSAQILAQDRANVHRFGIRQVGDAVDATFGTSEARGRFAELLARGTLGPGVAEAIIGDSMQMLNVQVYGSAGRADYVTVTVADGAAVDNGTQSPPVANEGQPGIAKWGYASGNVDGTHPKPLRSCDPDICAQHYPSCGGQRAPEVASHLMRPSNSVAREPHLVRCAGPLCCSTRTWLLVRGCEEKRRPRKQKRPREFL